MAIPIYYKLFVGTMGSGKSYDIEQELHRCTTYHRNPAHVLSVQWILSGTINKEIQQHWLSTRAGGRHKVDSFEYGINTVEKLIEFLQGLNKPQYLKVDYVLLPDAILFEEDDDLLSEGLLPILTHPIYRSRPLIVLWPINPYFACNGTPTKFYRFLKACASDLMNYNMMLTFKPPPLCSFTDCMKSAMVTCVAPYNTSNRRISTHPAIYQITCKFHQNWETLEHSIKKSNKNNSPILNKFNVNFWWRHNASGLCQSDPDMNTEYCINGNGALVLFSAVVHRQYNKAGKFGLITKNPEIVNHPCPTLKKIYVHPKNITAELCSGTLPVNCGACTIWEGSLKEDWINSNMHLHVSFGPELSKITSIGACTNIKYLRYVKYPCIAELNILQNFPMVQDNFCHCTIL